MMPRDQLRACINKARSHKINILCLNVQLLKENLKSQPCCIDIAIAPEVNAASLGLRFSHKDFPLGY